MYHVARGAPGRHPHGISCVSRLKFGESQLARLRIRQAEVLARRPHSSDVEPWEQTFCWPRFRTNLHRGAGARRTVCVLEAMAMPSAAIS